MNHTPASRIIISGVPKAGKTTLANDIRDITGWKVLQSDDLKGIDWSAASDAVSYWFGADSPWIIEGVATIRALRKWFMRNPRGKPCDQFIWIDEPKVELERGQDIMAKGCRTIFNEIEDKFYDHEVDVYNWEHIRANDSIQ